MDSVNMNRKSLLLDPGDFSFFRPFRTFRLPMPLGRGNFGSTTTWSGQNQPRLIEAATRRLLTCIVATRDLSRVCLDHRKTQALGP